MMPPVRYALAGIALVSAGPAAAQGSADVAACRDIKDSLLRLRCFDDVSAAPAGKGVPAQVAVKPGPPNFAQYAADAYRGPLRFPDFRGRDRAHAMYRTRIMEGARAGANFAGHLALVPIGCGAGCMFVPVVDVQTGRVFNFPLGGEDQMSLDMKYQINSRLVSARYIADERCKHEELIWTGSAFQRGRIRDLGDRETCYRVD